MPNLPHDDQNLGQSPLHDNSPSSWHDRYRILEQALALPDPEKRKIAGRYLGDENFWVQSLARQISSTEHRASVRSRRSLVFELDEIVRSARLTTAHRTRLIQLFEEVEESGSGTYLTLAADRAARLVTGLVSSLAEFESSSVDLLREFLAHVAAYAQPTIEPGGWVPLVAVLESIDWFDIPCEIVGDPQYLVREDAVGYMLAELIRNDRDAHSSAVTITLSGHKNGAQLLWRSSGEGVSARNAKRIFDPWFTTRPGRAGMGLYLASRTSAQFGGTIRLVELEPVTFLLELPNPNK